MLKKFVLAAMVLGVAVAAGCNPCNKCKVKDSSPCGCVEATPCGETCDK